MLAWFSEHINLSTRAIDYYNVSNSEHTECLPACYKNSFVNFKMPMNFEFPKSSLCLCANCECYCYTLYFQIMPYKVLCIFRGVEEIPSW